MRTLARAVTTILAMALLGPAVLGQAGVKPRAFEGREQGAVLDGLAALPADVDAVIAFRSLADLRSSEASRFVADSLAAGAFDQVREGWGELAGAVGLSPSEAFDAVLGERVVIAIRRGDRAIPDWTVQAAVSSNTEKQLRRKLRVAPRTIVAGQTLYAVERGALELSVLRPAEHKGPARVVLAPAGSALFAEVLRAGQNGVRSILDTPPGKAVLELPPGDVIVLARLREREDSWAAMVGTVGRDSFDASIKGALDHNEPTMARASVWNEAQARKTARGSLAAIFDSKSSAVYAVGKEIGGLFAADIQDVFECDEDITGREAVLLSKGPSGAPTMLAAVELHDLHHGAVLGDRAMDLLLEKFGMKPRGFDGLAPSAVRRVADGAVSIAWVFDAIPQREEPHAEGWWIHTTDPERLDDSRGIFRALDAPAEGVRTYAIVHPAALLEAIASSGAPLPDAVRGLRRIESIEWVERAAPMRSVEANLSIRFAGRESHEAKHPVAGSRTKPAR